MSYTNSLYNFKELIIGADTKVPLNNKKYTKAINFDNAATTPPFKHVLDEIFKFSPWYSSIHRGAGYKSQLSSGLYDNARNKIATFVGADIDYHSIIFVKNATEAINKLSNKLLPLFKDDVVLSTFMEHHSNDLPWRNKYKIDYIDLDQYGALSIESLKNKLEKYKGKVKLVTVTGASNVTGYINPIYKIAELAHKHGAKILVDGAQLVPHAPIDMKSLDDPQHIDFLVFSGHKMYAPFGSGVLIGPKEIFSKSPPDYSGGGTVAIVTPDLVTWLDPPEREEAGTPNLIGVLGITWAIEVLNRIGMNAVDDYEKMLTAHALDSLHNIPFIQLYNNDKVQKNQVSIIPFNIKGLHHEIVANILSHEFGIAVRNGCFCAQPYIQKLLNILPEDTEKYIDDPTLPMPGVVRLSFGIYNTIEEINILVKALYKICSDRKYYYDKYAN